MKGCFSEYMTHSFTLLPGLVRKIMVLAIKAEIIKVVCLVPMKEVAFGLSTPLGSRWKSYSTESTTTV